MSLSAVLALFLAHLAIGIAFTLIFVSREAGVKFFRFNAGLASALAVIALAFQYEAPLLLAAAALVFCWATIGRIFTRYQRQILVAATGVGVVAIVLQALAVSAAWTPAARALTVASHLSSAALLGGACTAMILGHWYLILPSMEVRHLQSIVRLHIASMLVRIAVVVAAVAVAILTWQPGLGPSFRRYVTSVDGIFFWQRVLFGLAGPAVLSYLTWQTAKIRSTQSATGILYVDFFTVVVGEALAKYLLLATRVPV
jgi:hypothetical protein